MAETPNYGLYIEDDSSVLFKDWRERINGSTDSNAIKIDNALAELASKEVSQATSDAYGGVKADPVTETDTQPVRIGADGKLYTAPATSNNSSDGSSSDVVSPVVTVGEIDGGHRITVVDVNGTQTFDVLDGYTPVKGTDYYTEEDKTELVEAVLAALPAAEEASV